MSRPGLPLPSPLAPLSPLALPLLLALAACGAPPTDDDDAPAPDALVQAFRQNQGTVLQGNPVHVSRFNARRGAVYVGITDADGTLRASNGKGGDDAWMIGLVLRGVDQQSGVPVELRVTRACPHHRPPQNWLRPLDPWAPPEGCDWPEGFEAVPGQFSYVVERRPLGGGPWTPLCDGWNRALPHGGVWNATGGHDVSSTELTLACVSNVIVKCTNWGYAPWQSYGGQSLWDYHQSCTRMAMADYCGTGESYTEERTQIDLSDKLDFRKADMDLPFEAGWRPSGALCLSKLRWQTIKPGGLCASIPDPRRDPMAPPCDGYGDRPLLVGIGARMFSGSAFIDKGLWRWQKDSDAFTTTQGYWSLQPADLQPPAPGYAMLAYEGAVFSATAPKEVRPLADTRLYSYRDGAGRHLTTTLATPPLGYGFRTLEGYIYAPGPKPTPRAVRLVRYRRGVTSEYVTTTGAPPPGFGAPVVEGWLPRGP